jgi:hypothetical protein
MRCRTLLASLAVFGACEADHTLGTVEPDAGYNQAVTGTDTRPSISLDSPAFLADGNMPTMSQTLDAEGVDMEPLGPLGPSQSWTGYAENFQFPSGSDAIKFSFAYDPSGQVVGQVILGSGTPPPPATDPNVGYPPGYNGFNVLFADAEGFPFSMVGGNFVFHRLRFAIEGTELWASWCALQTPPADGSDGCLPNFVSATVGEDSCSITTANGKTTAVDCTKWYLCEGAVGFSSASVCLCTPTGCIPRPGRNTISFDMFISDDTASGSVSGYLGTTGDTHNVHFTKDP